MPATSQHVHGPAGSSAHDAAGLPRQGHDLPGLDPRWSRVVVAPDAEGVRRSWHVLDTGPLLEERGEVVVATLLCVHGNPNVLTADQPSSQLTQGCTGQHAHVEIERCTTSPPAPRYLFPPPLAGEV